MGPRYQMKQTESHSEPTLHMTKVSRTHLEHSLHRPESRNLAPGKEHGWKIVGRTQITPAGNEIHGRNLCPHHPQDG